MTKICLIGIDGLRLPIGLEASSTLAEFAEQGSRADLVMEVPTLSGPGWSSLLTGTTHAEHGVKDNTFTGHRLWNHPDLLSRAFYKNQATTTFAAASWPPLVDPAGVGPVIHTRIEQQRAEQHRVIVRDGETHGYRATDADIAVWAEKALLLGVDVSFVYFCGVDEAGHLFGPLGPEYRAAIAQVDRHIQTLVQAVQRRSVGLGEDWLMVVVTDHGHVDEGGHGGDSAVERSSFALARRFGGGALDWPAEFAPHELTDILLSYVPAGR